MIRTAKGNLESRTAEWLTTEWECASCGYARTSSEWYRASRTFDGFRRRPGALIVALAKLKDERDFLYEQRESAQRFVERIELRTRKQVDDHVPGRWQIGCRFDTYVWEGRFDGADVSLFVESRDGEDHLRVTVTR